MSTETPPLSEKRFMMQVQRLAKYHRWTAYHVFDSRRSAYGFPDLVLVRPPRVIFAELKREDGKVSAFQRAWLDLLAQCGGVESYVWRPSDWSLIEAVLQ